MAARKNIIKGETLARLRIWGGYLGIEYIFRTYILPSYVQNRLREIEIEREINRLRERERGRIQRFRDRNNAKRL